MAVCVRQRTDKMTDCRSGHRETYSRMHNFPCRTLQILAVTLTLAAPAMSAAADLRDGSAASAPRELGKPDR